MGVLSSQFCHYRRLVAWVAAVLAVGAAALELPGQTDGTRRWGPFSVGGQHPKIESSPAIGPDGTIYIGVANDTTPAAGRLLAIDRNGSPKWSATLPDWVDSSPALSADGTTVYVGCWDGGLYAYATANGAPRWNYPTGPNNYIVSSPAVAPDGTIYVGAGDFIGAQESGLYAVDANGNFRWKKLTPGVVESSPAIGADGTIYFGNAILETDKVADNHFYAIAADGTTRWEFPTGSAVWGPPAIGADGTIYFGTFAGRLYALSPDGTEKWQYQTGGAIFGGPAIGADGAIYVGAYDWNLYALNPDHTLRWTASVGQPILSTPAIRADGSIIVGADDYRVHAYNAEGKEQWSLATTYRIQSSPVVADGSIYVAALDGQIYALNSTAAPLSSFSTWPMFHREPAHRGVVPPPHPADARLINLSTRAFLNADTNLIAGFVVRGTTTKYYLVRAIGPTLAEFGVTDPLSDPTITLRRQSTGVIVPGGFNDNWSDELEGPPASQTAAAVGAFALPQGSKDAVLVSLLDPSAYTAVVGSANGRSGTALVEAYDAARDATASVLVNLSTRGQVAAGASIIPGFVVGGTSPLPLLIRAVGPGLAQFGVSNVLASPTMSVFSGQTIIRTNTGWTSEGLKGDLAGAARAVGAFPLADNSVDCAALVTLNPGNYTIQVSGVSDTTGEVLVEIYVVP